MGTNQDIRLQTACFDLRHKLMECDTRHMVRGKVDDTSDTRVFFCAKTHDQFGPDGETVDPDSCHTGRACYCHGVRGRIA